MDASGADKLILLVQTNQVLYDKPATGYKVKDALEKGDIWQIGVDIAVNSERTTDLRCRFSFLGGGVTDPSNFSFLVSRFSFLVPRFSFLGGGVTWPLVFNVSSRKLKIKLLNLRCHFPIQRYRNGATHAWLRPQWHLSTRSTFQQTGSDLHSRSGSHRSDPCPLRSRAKHFTTISSSYSTYESRDWCVC